MTRLERITKQITKTKTVIAEHQDCLRELERQKTEIENADLIKKIRGFNLTNDEIMAILNKREKDDDNYHNSQISSLTTRFNEGGILEIEN